MVQMGDTRQVPRLQHPYLTRRERKGEILEIKACTSPQTVVI